MNQEKMKCSECGVEFTENDYIAYCEDHEEYFHDFTTPCHNNHSRNKHGTLYRAVILREGKLEFV
jgi:hypothetical protein